MLEQGLHQCGASHPPRDRRHLMLWGGTALVFALAPLVFSQSFALTLLTQMGTMIVFALSYNMLLGQAGMLSFGHAVYSGLAAYVAAHALNAIGKGSFPFPVTLLPLIGGLAGAGFGVLFGYVTTRKSGTIFAMISLGIGELVFACVLMFPGFFGGESGISTNRVVGNAVLGINYGSALQVYYLVAAWCLVSIAAMYALTHTPLGRMVNAVRDNPERAEFVGYDAQKLRFFQLVLSAFFAGVSGALTCINFEIVSAENVSALRSGAVLLATFIGGVPYFFGPILGAIVFVLFFAGLSAITRAWLFYLGLFFLLIVLYAPGGIASLLVAHWPALRNGRWRDLLWPYCIAACALLVALAGLVGLVETVYRISDGTPAAQMALFGLRFDASQALPWLVCAGALAAGLAALRHAARRLIAPRWAAIMRDLPGAGA